MCASRRDTENREQRNSVNMSGDELNETIRPGRSGVSKELPVESMKIKELREELKKMNLRTTGKKTELRDRLRTALSKQDKNESDEEDEGTEEDEDTVESNEENAGGCASRSKKYLPTFRDVEESVTSFSGDDNKCIKRWITDFEDISTLCKWTEVQKIIYAKSLLRGSAKSFVNYERCTKSWTSLRKALKDEFSTKVSSHDVHRQLASRKKKPDESYHEYIYAMIDIAAQADVEKSAIIQYIIDGVPGDEVYKSVLYGAVMYHL